MQLQRFTDRSSKSDYLREQTEEESVLDELSWGQRAFLLAAAFTHLIYLMPPHPIKWWVEEWLNMLVWAFFELV